MGKFDISSWFRHLADVEGGKGKRIKIGSGLIQRNRVLVLVLKDLNKAIGDDDKDGGG